MITTVSFDLDDTLWNPRPALIAADKAQWHALSEIHPQLTEHFSQDRIFRCRKKVLEHAPSIIGDVTALRLEVMIQLLTALGIDAEQAASSAATAFTAFMARRNDVVLFSDAIEILKQLCETYRLVAITNGNANVFKTELGVFFELAIRADEVGIAKPDRGIFDLTWERLGCAATEVVHVGDSVESDVLGALNAGVTPVWYNPNGEPNRLDVNEISSLTELPALLGSTRD
jgi:putative hydrolase of the HAD superfamily